MLLLEKAVERIAGEHFRVIMQRLLIEVFCIGIYRFALGLFRSTVGFQLAVTALPANCTACAMLGKFFGFMPAFHADVFMLDLMDFSVRLYCGLPQRTA